MKLDVRLEELVRALPDRMTRGEVAEHLGVTLRTVDRMLRDGRLTACPSSGTYWTWIWTDSVIALLRERQQA